MQIDALKGGDHVIVGELFRSASVVRLEDGKVVRRTLSLRGSDSAEPLPWSNPKLIGEGSMALEIVPEQLSLRLVKTATGDALLTFVVLPAGEWIVHTPHGRWDGSKGVHNWVKFYRGPLCQGSCRVA